MDVDMHSPSKALCRGFSTSVLIVVSYLNTDFQLARMCTNMLFFFCFYKKYNVYKIVNMTLHTGMSAKVLVLFGL